MWLYFLNFVHISWRFWLMVRKKNKTLDNKKIYGHRENSAYDNQWVTLLGESLWRNIISIIVCCQKYHLFQSTSTKPQNWRIFYLKSHSKNMTEITENTSSSWHLFSIFVPKLGLVHPWDSYLTIFHRSVRLSWTCFLHFCSRNNQEIKSA